MMKQLILGFVLLFGSFNSFCQDNEGAIYGQFNTILIYSNYTLNYESKDIINQFEKHSLRFSGGLGGWTTSAFNKNSGTLLNYGINYNYGSKSHLLEFGLTYQNHFDKGLKDQPIVFIGSTFRPFFGYRYQPLERKLFFKIGTGWREVVQIGLGYRF